MFEKEAKEIAKGIYTHHFDDDINYPDVLKAITVGVQKGAEFGYNKANEWHNPKEKLPTKDCEVLIEYDDHKIHRVVDWNNKSKRFGGLSIDEVTWWKEIVLPELKG